MDPRNVQRKKKEKRKRNVLGKGIPRTKVFKVNLAKSGELLSAFVERSSRYWRVHAR